MGARRVWRERPIILRPRFGNFRNKRDQEKARTEVSILNVFSLLPLLGSRESQLHMTSTAHVFCLLHPTLLHLRLCDGFLVHLIRVHQHDLITKVLCNLG